MTELTCYSCHHSRHNPLRSLANPSEHLECAKTGRPAVKRCEDFVYEPGTDECERGKL